MARDDVAVMLDANRVREVVADALAVHRHVFGEAEAPYERFAKVRDDLSSVWLQELDRERTEVAALEAHWPELTRAAFAKAVEFRGLLDQLDRAREPAALPTTLLGPLRLDLDEVSHTRVLGCLMNPAECGPLGVRLLRATLSLVPGLVATADMLSDTDLAAARVQVEPEWRIGKKGLSVYPDLVVDVARPGKNLLVVVENKIRAHDREGQLDSYAEHARDRDDADVFLVYLTPSGEKPSASKWSEREWLPLSYRQLAIAWRRELARTGSPDAWTEILRLYLATVVQAVLEKRITDTMSRATQASLVDYMHAALGK